MNIKEAFEAYLNALAPLTALVSDRIFFGERIATTDLPAVTFYRSGGNSVQQSRGHGAMGVPKFTVECWGNDGAEAESVALAIRGPVAGPGLESFTPGLMGTLWVGAVRVDNAADDKIPPAFGEQQSDHRVSLEVTLWHDE